MSGVVVVTDSGSDLPAQLADELGIEIVPLTVRFGDEEFVDRRDLSAREFWSRLARSPVLPQTAAPSPGAFEQVFRRAADAGAEGVVCVTLSSALSATYEAAEAAARAVAGTVPVEVVDSRAVTMAEGLLAVAAARTAKGGRGLDECAAATRALVPRTRTFATLDTLENLKKGGRIGAAQAFLGSVLSIKPVIQVADGKVEPESRQRTRSKALRHLVDLVRQFPVVEDLWVLHGDAPDVGEVLDQLATFHDRSKIGVGDVGPVIGTHAGPRVIGVTFRLPS